MKNLLDIRLGELKSIFDALEEAFLALQIDFYVIGAMARDIWYSKNNRESRQTRDVDFAVFIAAQEDYAQLREYLVAQKQFIESTTNAYVIISPEGLAIDLLPFGEIEIDEQVTIPGKGLTSIRVNGFEEVYNFGTVNMDIETGHSFQVATLPAIVLLKIISYGDRPDQRTKDPTDISNIIQHYFNIQSDLIYDNHSDLFGEDEKTLEQIAGRVIGREIKQIIHENEKLMLRVTSFLSEHIELAEKSAFVRNMQSGDNFIVQTAIQWLEEINKGINE